MPDSSDAGFDPSGAIGVTVDPRGWIVEIEVAADWSARVPSGDFGAALLLAYGDAVRTLTETAPVGPMHNVASPNGYLSLQFREMALVGAKNDPAEIAALSAEEVRQEALRTIGAADQLLTMYRTMYGGR